jgi:hypothetical protein
MVVFILGRFEARVRHWRGDRWHVSDLDLVMRVVFQLRSAS